MRTLVLATVVVLVTVVGLPEVSASTSTAVHDEPIEMSDGVALVADVDVPPGDGPFPVVLQVTPYGRLTYSASYLIDGYAHVNVDVRGTGRSGGINCVTCARERDDVVEVIEWAAHQPWSTGRVGMIGGSYSAFLQLLAAAEHPEGLAAIVPRASWSDPYRDGWYQNGLFNESVVTAFSGFQPVGGSTGASADARSISALAAHTQNPTPLQLALEHPFDDEFYAERAIYPRYDDITVPALFIDGWFDMFRAGAVRNFNGVASRDKRLIIGPWTHHRAGGLGEIFPEPYPDVLLPEGDPVLAWLDHYVKGIDNGVERAPRVVSYDLGTDDWTLGDAFPPRGASAAALDLSGAPSGSIVSLHDGSLVAHSPRSTGTDGDSYLYDPTSGPTQATGADNATFVGPFADLDQRPDEERTVTYTTAPLGSSLDLRGWMELDLWSTTSAADTDWVVKVSDVQPDGTSRLVSRGFVRASHRAVDPARSRSMQPWLRNDRAEPVAAGSPTEYRIPIEPAGRTLAPGHRLRLSISSSDIAVHQPLPVPAWNTILHDREHPSVLRLQVAADGPKATVME